jgi:hypothetical protein
VNDVKSAIGAAKFTAMLAMVIAQPVVLRHANLQNVATFGGVVRVLFGVEQVHSSSSTST